MSDKSPERRRRHRERRRQRRLAVVGFLKAGPCTDCGNSYPPYVMDFDHVRGEKALHISREVNGNMSMDRIMAEIAKCELVCANCHRIRTHSRRVPGERSVKNPHYAGNAGRRL